MQQAETDFRGRNPLRCAPSAAAGVLLIAFCLANRTTAQDENPVVPPVRIADPLLNEEVPADDRRTADVESPEENTSEPDGAEPEALETLLPLAWHEFGPITAQVIYTSEVFSKAAGGGLNPRSATRYRGDLDVTLDLDTEDAGWWEGGHFFAYMQQDHGETLTRRFVGDGQLYSNIDTSPFPQDLTRLSSYWYEHGAEGRELKAGKLNANLDFAYPDLSVDFINSSFGTLSNVPLPTWPFQTLGVTGLYEPDPKWRLGGGIYDQGRDYDQWWMTTATRGLFFLSQTDWKPFAEEEGDVPVTQLRFGAWFTSSDVVGLDGSARYPNNYGFYATIDQMLIVEEPGEAQGLGAFFFFSWAPQDRNEVDRNIGAGLTYRGPSFGYERDLIGLGFTLIEFSAALPAPQGGRSETAVELFYQVRPHDWLRIQPDLQYIASPSGIYPDALVVGMRLEVLF